MVLQSNTYTGTYRVTVVLLQSIKTGSGGQILECSYHGNLDETAHDDMVLHGVQGGDLQGWCK
jgi:hypothetical protein